MPIDDVLQSLLAGPKAFLESNALVIYGSNKSGSGVKDFVLQGTDETGWRSAVGNVQAAVPLFVMYDAAGFNAKPIFDTFVGPPLGKSLIRLAAHGAELIL